MSAFARTCNNDAINPFLTTLFFATDYFRKRILPKKEDDLNPSTEMRRKTIIILTAALLTLTAPQSVQADNRQEATGTAARPAKLSETDAYLDLNTGKQFHFIYDGLNEVYNRDDLFAAEYYVNTRTRDTLWLDAAINVNHALRRDADGKYRIDPMKVKRDGQGYRVVVRQAAAQ